MKKTGTKYKETRHQNNQEQHNLHCSTITCRHQQENAASL